MMAKTRAAIGSLVFLVVVPGVVAGLIPGVLTGWHLNRYLMPAQLGGFVVAAAGVAVLLGAFAQFVLEGGGTPAPVAPPERLVVRGVYRYVRNPMYLAVGAVILGQAVALGQPILLVYLVVFVVAVFMFVRGYEEPTLRGRFGASYDAYVKAVPAWVPRLTPWTGGAERDSS
jgi:protein-S-isoprenylcysteine O-methyltransferase Ste14